MRRMMSWLVLTRVGKKQIMVCDFYIDDLWSKLFPLGLILTGHPAFQHRAWDRVMTDASHPHLHRRLFRRDSLHLCGVVTVSTTYLTYNLQGVSLILPKHTQNVHFRPCPNSCCAALRFSGHER